MKAGISAGIDRARGRLAVWSGRLLASIPGTLVYLAMALGVAGWGVAHLWTDRGHHVSSATYDRMIAWRVHPPRPDPAIAILDIDERSLSAMSAEHGRWPWPRDVLAAVLEDLERQGARAVVFDILFADPDVRNPGAERAFSDAVAGSRVSFFPVLRLAPRNDAASTLRLSQLGGLLGPAAPAAADRDPTVALVLPYFDSVVASGRLGTFNLHPDRDSLVRRYQLWESIEGQRLMSLPARVAADLGWGLPPTATQRINWPDPQAGYRTVSFADFYQDTQRAVRTRPPGEFRDAIVVIGASAPALGDVKATPVRRLHAGVDILATTLDNLHNDRLLREIPLPWQTALALLLLAIMTWSTIRYAHDALSWAFVVAPSAMLAVSYLSLNVGGLFGHVFLDLSGAASMAFLYYSLARLYNTHLRQYWAGERHYRRRSEGTRVRWCGMLAADLGPSRPDGRELRLFDTLHRVAPHATLMLRPAGTMGWIARDWDGVVLAAWHEALDDGAAVELARAEAKALSQALATSFGARTSALVDSTDARGLRALSAGAMAALAASDGSTPSTLPLAKAPSADAVTP